MRTSYLIIPFLLLIISCADQGADFSYANAKVEVPNLNYEEEIEIEPPSTMELNALPSIDETLLNRKIIKSANCRIQVENIEVSTQQIQERTTAVGGIVSNMDFNSDKHEVNNRITILVPNKKFEQLLEDLTVDAKFINYKKITSTDVSEEFVDIQSRLATKKQVRDRYTEILRSRAATINEIFQAEEKIRVLQEEIEAKEGRLNYLQEKVAHSTIQIEIYETVFEQSEPIAYTASIKNQFVDSFASGWNVVLNIILVLISFWPLLFFGGIGFLLFKRMR